ncbi:MAG: class I SAM-dependent methyltransferase [Alphaproteobacteria bacterium]|nr:class I SAM-dependent methyltransferase [Alphaproteobacteria bacterium]
MKKQLKQLLRRIFVLGQSFGVDILPRHFYSEIPDIGKLRRNLAWRRPYAMTHVQGNDCDKQVEFARRILRVKAPDLAAIYARACKENGAEGFGPMEAEVLYAYILSRRPKAIIQIGAGVSTSVILQAAKEAGYQPSLCCIDPYPTAFLERLAREGKIDLIAKRAEEIDAGIVSRLGEGDLLFVDSTHSLGPAGEVTRIVLEWLPNLGEGVQVHFHDITFPYDYDPNILQESLFFPHETALLLAFLSLNSDFRILCSLSMLHHERQPELRKILPRYNPMKNDGGVASAPGHFPSSIFLERFK